MTRILQSLKALHMGDRPQGVAGDCNSLAETHAWFDSRVAHHFLFIRKICGICTLLSSAVVRIILEDSQL